MFTCFRTAKGMALLVLAFVVGGYFVIWHQQHVLVALPFIILLACPLMHLLMHGGHSHRHTQASDRADGERK